jgi:hypothetical protein
MNKAILFADFIRYVEKNYENFDKFRSEYNVLEVRNHAAQNGVEMTPEEVEDCFDMIIAALEFIDNQNSY